MTTNTAAANTARIHRATDAAVVVVLIAAITSAMFAPQLWLTHDIAGHFMHILDVVDDELRHMVHGIRHRIAHRRAAV
jgi:hypothetical protein